MAQQPVTGGAVVAEALERCGIRIAFGLVSVHNMPILDAICARGRIRFVPARGEAGATAMADAYARASGRMAAVISSTGPGAANAVSALIEAQSAGTPLLHVTGQIPHHLIGRAGGSVHDCPDQLGMLAAVSKAALRVTSVEAIAGTIAAGARMALSPPCGPVSVEVPIDIQKRLTARPATLDVLTVGETQPAPPAPAALDALAGRLAGCRRVMLWLGAGAAHAGDAAQRLAALGFGIVTSTHGRGTLPEDHPMSLGALNVQRDVVAFYASCDAMLVVGSRLRGHETRDFNVALPQPLYQIDIDPAANGRSYPCALFIEGDAAEAMAGLADRLHGRFRPDPGFAADLALARDRAGAAYRRAFGPYGDFSDLLRRAAPRDTPWVRDITLANSAWGNRLFQVFRPEDNIYPVAAGIGLGTSLAIGASLGSGRRVLCLCGDGGFSLNLAEVCTAVQEKTEAIFLVMNDRGYGVIRNIQDSQYGGRQFYVDVVGPELETFARSVGLAYLRIERLDDVIAVIGRAFAARGPVLVEADMGKIGPFPKGFPPPPADHNRAAPPRS